MAGIADQPTGATLPSTSALVETVVPWTIRSVAARKLPAQPMGLGGEAEGIDEARSSRGRRRRFEDLEAPSSELKHQIGEGAPISTQARTSQLSFFSAEARLGLSAEARPQALGVRKKIDHLEIPTSPSRRKIRSGAGSGPGRSPAAPAVPIA